MSRPSGSALLFASVFVVGCEAPLVDDLLMITFGAGEFAPPAEIDVACGNGGCDGFEQLEAELHFAAHDLVSDEATVEILLYRVDYDILGFDEDAEGVKAPYYANATSVLVPVGGSATFNVKAAGQAQRAWVEGRFGASQVDAVGTLTLTGYDHKNASVTVATDFDISFGDFVSDSSN